jgi:hypothetical protein
VPNSSLTIQGRRQPGEVALVFGRWKAAWTYSASTTRRAFFLLRFFLEAFFEAFFETFFAAAFFFAFLAVFLDVFFAAMSVVSWRPGYEP